MATSADSEREEYLDERRINIEAETEQSSILDKSLLTLSSGALGLSLALADRIVPDGALGLARWLVVTWCLFGLASVSTLLSLFVSIQALRRARDILDDKQASGKRGAAADKANPYATATYCLNMTALISFIAGTVVLSWLVWRSLSTG